MGTDLGDGCSREVDHRAVRNGSFVSTAHLITQSIKRENHESRRAEKDTDLDERLPVSRHSISSLDSDTR